MRLTYSRTVRGFTLVELMVVMAILLILAGLGALGLLRVQNQASRKVAETQIKRINLALDEYRQANGSFPVGEGSKLLYRVLYWDPAQAEREVFLPGFQGGSWISGSGPNATVVDPWGREYGYICLGEKNPGFDLWSAGPDGEADRQNLEAEVNRDNVE